MNEQDQILKQQIIKNLNNNNFPERKVSLPMDKLYEIADKKGANLNTVLDSFEKDEQIFNKKTGDKIIFFKNDNDKTDTSKENLMKQAQEFMKTMTPEQMKEIQEQLANLTPEQKKEMMGQAKEMGL